MVMLSLGSSPILVAHQTRCSGRLLNCLGCVRVELGKGQGLLLRAADDYNSESSEILFSCCYCCCLELWPRICAYRNGLEYSSFGRNARVNRMRHAMTLLPLADDESFHPTAHHRRLLRRTV